MFIRLCYINAVHTKDFKTNCTADAYLFLHLKTPARFYLDGKIINAKVNDIILFKKGTHMFYEATEESYIDDYIFFNTQTEEDERFMEQLSLKYNQIMHLTHSLSLIDILPSICYEFFNRDLFSNQAIDHLLKFFLIKLNECMNKKHLSTVDNTLYEKFQKFRLVLYSNPGRKWTVANMAAHINLSPSYFHGIYKKLFGISPMADLLERRLSYAKELLKTTNQSINEISIQCGYESSIHFAKYFKQKTGMTPTDYRNQPKK